MCEICNKPNSSGDYDPCCNHGDGTCEGFIYDENETYTMCDHCGATLIKDEAGIWRHWTQMEIPFSERFKSHIVTTVSKSY